jgi:hypothetical protein
MGWAYGRELRVVKIWNKEVLTSFKVTVSACNLGRVMTNTRNLSGQKIAQLRFEFYTFQIQVWSTTTHDHPSRNSAKDTMPLRSPRINLTQMWTTHGSRTACWLRSILSCSNFLTLMFPLYSFLITFTKLIHNAERRLEVSTQDQRMARFNTLNCRSWHRYWKLV